MRPWVWSAALYKHACMCHTHVSPAWGGRGIRSSSSPSVAYRLFYHLPFSILITMPFRSHKNKRSTSHSLNCVPDTAECWKSNDGNDGLHSELTWPRLSREGVLWNSEEMGRGNFETCTGNWRLALQLWFAQTASVQQVAPNDWLQPNGLPLEKSAVQG